VVVQQSCLFAQEGGLEVALALVEKVEVSEAVLRLVRDYREVEQAQVKALRIDEL